MLDKFNPLDGYKILNKIIPKYFQTKFPYNGFSSEILVDLKAKIDKNQIAVYTPNKKNHKKGGGDNKFVIYQIDTCGGFDEFE